MKVVLQRVRRAKVHIEGTGAEQEIGMGLVLLCAVEKEDTEEILMWMAEKCVNLRIFEDSYGRMNLSVIDIQGDILAISNFTVAGNTKKGRRPSFDKAESPEKALTKFNKFLEYLNSAGLVVKTGKFGARMLVDIENYGPVTFIIEKHS